jgi:hypothetical protein
LIACIFNRSEVPYPELDERVVMVKVRTNTHIVYSTTRVAARLLFRRRLLLLLLLSLLLLSLLLLLSRIFNRQLSLVMRLFPA